MRLGWRDAVAAAMVGAATVVAAAALGEWGWPLLDSYRGAAAILVLLGLAACAVAGGGEGADQGRPPAFHGVLGGVSLSLHVSVGLLFVAALIVPSGGMLVGLTGTLVALWLVGTAHHALGGSVRRGRAVT